MDIEQSAQLAFLRQTPPLDELPEAALHDWLAVLEIVYFRRQEQALVAGQQNEWLYLVRSGAFQVLDTAGEVVNEVAEGEWFGYRSLLEQGMVQYSVQALEDSLVYRFPKKVFLQAYQDYPIFQQFFAKNKPDRIRLALQQWQQTSTHLPLNQPVQAFIRPIECLSLNTTLQQAAQKLKQAEASPQSPWPILKAHQTTYFLLNERLILKAVAEGWSSFAALEVHPSQFPLTQVSPDTPVGEILPQLVKQDGVLVASGATPEGFFSLQQLPPALDFTALSQRARRAQSFEALQTVADALPDYFVQLVRQKLPPQKVGRLISALGEALTQRTVALIWREMANEQSGLEGLSCAFLVAGSMARGEQTLKTDQDNALLLPDGVAFDETVLSSFTQKVTQQLDALGYEFCPGEMMASNPKWRQPLSQWQRYFQQWTTTPTPESILYAATFYDLKAVCGANELFEPLRQSALERAKNSGLFLHHLAANALTFQPPIGFFRHFILEQGCKSKDAQSQGLDLKKRGITPIVELARVYALSEGLPALNTWERLEQAQQAGVISQQGYEDLRDALDLIAQIRQQHQADCLEQHLPADNVVSPKSLSHLEQRHLKDAFAVVREMQEALRLTFLL